jgi:hypothetical protein
MQMAESEETKKEIKKQKPKLPDKPPIVTLTVELGEGTEITNKSMKDEEPKLQKEPKIVKVKLTVPLDKEEKSN